MFRILYPFCPNLQEALRSCLESSVVPAFEQSCKVMFEQVDNAFQKGMSEHITAAQQHLEATHTPLALTLRVSAHVIWSFNVAQVNIIKLYY